MRERTLLLAAVALGAVAVTHLIDFWLFRLRYRILNANVSSSWSHAVAAGALAVGAAVCLAGAWRSPRRRAALLVTATILVLFFTDEASGLHAHIDALSHGKALYAPLLAILVFCVWRLTRTTAYLASARAAAALLLVSYAIHVLEPRNIGHLFGWSPGDWEYQAVVALKEGAELAGVLVALLALWGSALRRS